MTPKKKSYNMLNIHSGNSVPVADKKTMFSVQQSTKNEYSVKRPSRAESFSASSKCSTDISEALKQKLIN